MSEAIGLRAILETKEFRKGMKIYLSGLAVLDDKTNKTARGINTGLGNANKGFLSANKGALALGVGLAGLAGGVFIVKELAEGILKVGAATVSSAADMEQQLANITSLMGGTADEAAELKGLITDLGLDPGLKVSATEAADSIELLVRNGVELDDIMAGAARSSIALANATGAEFGTAADIATDTMALFNIEAANMNDAVDGITSVVASSKFDINDYRLALAQAGGVASAVGVGFDDFNTSIAAISPLFASGSDAGTSFKTFLQTLVPKSEDAAGAMKQLGLFTGLTDKKFESVSKKIEKTKEKISKLDPTTKNYQKKLKELNGDLGVLESQLVAGSNAFFDSQGNMKSMSEISTLLANATAGLSDEQKNQAFSTIFGTDAMRAAFGLANSGASTMITLADGTEVAASSFDTLQDKMGEMDAAVLIDKRMDTLQGTMEIIGGVFETVGLKIGDALLPSIRNLANSFLKLTEKVMPLVEPALVMIERGMSSFANSIMSTLTPAIDGAIGLLGGLLGIDANIGLGVSGTEDEPELGFIGKFQAQFSGIADIASDAMETVKGVFSSAVGFITETVVPGFMRLFDTIAGGDEPVLTVSGIWESVLKPALQSVGMFIENILTPAFNTFIDIFGSILPPIIKQVSSIWTNLLVPALSKFGQMAEFVFGVWQESMPVFQKLAEDAFGRLKTVIDFVSENVMPFFLAQLDKLFIFWEENGPLIISVIEKLGVFAQESFTVFMQVVEVAWAVISPIIGGAIDIILLLGKQALQIMNGDWADAWETGDEIINTAIMAMLGSVAGLIDQILGFFGTSMDGAIQAWADSWQMAKDIVSSIGNSILESWGGVWNNIVEIVSIAIDSVISFFSAEHDWHKIGFDTMTALLDGISEVWDLIKKVFTDGSVLAINTIFNALETISTGIDNALQFIFETMREGIQVWIAIIFDTDWFGIGSDVLNFIADGVGGALDSIQVAFMAVIQRIKDIFASASEFASIGSAVVEGIIQGLVNSAGILNNAITNLGQGMLEALQGSLRMASPSKEGIAIGENFTGSIEMGITSGAASLNRAATNLFDVSAISGAASKVAKAISGSFSSVLGSIDGISDFAESLFDVKEISEGIFTAKNLFGSDRDFSFGEGGTTGTVNLLNNLEKQRNFLKTQEQLLGNIVKLGLDYESVTQGIVVGPAAGLLDTLKLQQRISEQLRNGDVARLESQVEFAKNQRSLSLEQQQSLKKARSLAEKFFNVSQANSNEVFAISGGDMVDISSDIVLSRIKVLDTINKENDATVRQIKLLAQVKELGLDFEEATAGINILSPNILDSLILEKRINQEILDQNKERLRLTQDTAAAEEEIARKEAIIAGKEAEIKKIKQLQKIMSDIQAQATQGFDPADILNGITLGLDTSQDDLLDIMVNLSRNALQAMQDEFEIASPSKKTTRFGEQLGEGLKMGVLRKERDVVNAMTSVSSSMVSAPVAPSADIQMQSNSVLTKLLTRALGRQSITNNVAMPVTNNISNGMQAAEATAMFGNQLAGVVGMPQ